MNFPSTRKSAVSENLLAHAARKSRLFPASLKNPYYTLCSTRVVRAHMCTCRLCKSLYPFLPWSSPRYGHERAVVCRLINSWTRFTLTNLLLRQDDGDNSGTVRVLSLLRSLNDLVPLSSLSSPRLPILSLLLCSVCSCHSSSFRGTSLPSSTPLRAATLPPPMYLSLGVHYSEARCENALRLHWTQIKPSFSSINSPT